MDSAIQCRCDRDGREYSLSRWGLSGEQHPVNAEHRKGCSFHRSSTIIGNAMNFSLSRRSIGGALCCIVLCASCADEVATTNPPAEFVASNADFAGYASWTKVAGPLSGPDPAGLLSGGAHEGSNPIVSRTVYVNNGGAVRGNGQFPNGTIFVKTLTDSAGNVPMITAMAKRGGSFNTSHKGWEWFLLDPATGSVTARSDTLMGGMCNGCHTASSLGDYVFTK